MNTLDLQSKITRAVRALILSTGSGTAGDTYAAWANSFSTPRAFPNTTIEVEVEGFPDVLGTGNYRFPEVRLTFKDRALAQPTDPKGWDPLIAAQRRYTAVLTCLLQTTGDSTLEYTRVLLNQAARALANPATYGANPNAATIAANNADMVDFTFLDWLEGSLGSHVQKDDDSVIYLERVATFECVACNSNVD